jgi:DNA-binding MarR family transcriptional regulator
MALIFLSPIHKASRQISLYMEEAMRGSAVSPQEGPILSYMNSYAPCPISQLVRVFGIKQSTLTSLLDRLESRGYISRSINPEDRRSFLVSIEPPGRALAEQIGGIVERLEKDLLAAVDEDQLRGFQSVMKAIEQVTHATVRERSA